MSFVVVASVITLLEARTKTELLYKLSVTDKTKMVKIGLAKLKICI